MKSVHQLEPPNTGTTKKRFPSPVSPKNFPGNFPPKTKTKIKQLPVWPENSVPKSEDSHRKNLRVNPDDYSPPEKSHLKQRKSKNTPRTHKRRGAEQVDTKKSQRAPGTSPRLFIRQKRTSHGMPHQSDDWNCFADARCSNIQQNARDQRSPQLATSSLASLCARLSSNPGLLPSTNSALVSGIVYLRAAASNKLHSFLCLIFSRPARRGHVRGIVAHCLPKSRLLLLLLLPRRRTTG